MGRAALPLSSHPHNSRELHLTAMTIEPGVYRISSLETSSPIGRYYLEDMSLLPKVIMTLPNVEIQPLPPTLNVDTGERGYFIKALGVSTGLRDNSNEVVAVVVDEVGGKIVEWNLKPAGSEDQYLICHPENSNDVWTVSDEDAPPQTGEKLISVTKLQAGNPKQIFSFEKAAPQ
ncbi:hypothetical protein D9756_008878 [Leucocoprinus leucothites]|uniref:Uncharacterized protein n=1 Tax=Leucocoprinus leucothites TaxID=201217 RepID=A0A8H5FUY1_9AGAR|nr:hypothetical protein D9756_008878 [Leucoagaricus leucothites]